MEECKELMDMFKEKKAILCDCDGTIAYTDLAHEKAYELAFNEFGLSFDVNLFKELSPFGGDILMQKMVIDHPNNIDGAVTVEDIVSAKQIHLDIALEKFLFPNTALINVLNKSGLPVIIVTNGRYNSIKQIVQKVGLEYTCIVSKEKYEKPKPFADPYEVAMRMFRLIPKDVIVFEDNSIGIESAFAAGIEDVIQIEITNAEAVNE